MESHVPINRNESWTNEKHVHFLNSMEARFVRTMLENNARHTLRLDRHVPDSSESTLDCKQNRTRKKHTTSADFIGKSRSKMKGRPDKRSRRPPSSHHQPQYETTSQDDQVVPQIETTTGDKDQKPDLPNVPVSVSIAPAAS